MFSVEIDKKITIPLYIQLFEQIANKINNGVLKGGAKLPSQRELAEKYNISINTVINAYNMLVQYEYVTALNRSGYYVVEKNFEDELKDNKWHNTFSCKYNFSRNGVDLKMTEPFKMALRQSAKLFAEQGFSYPDYMGEYELRKQICVMLNKTCEINCLPTQIVIGPNVNYLLDLLIRVIGVDKVYAFENPTYYKVQEFIKLSKYNTRYLNVSEKGVTQTQLKDFNADVLFLMPYHHYPISSSLTVEQKNAVIQWAKNDRYIIEYGYDNEFVYDGGSKPMFSMTEDKNVIYMNDFTKTISSCLSVAYLVLPEPLVKRWQEAYLNFHSYESKIEQVFISKIIKNGSYYRNLNRLKKNYQEKRQLVISAIKNHKIGNKIEIKNYNAGTFLLIEPKINCDVKKLIVECHKEGVKLSCLINALEQPNDLISSKTFVLGFGGLSEEEIKKGIELLLNVWEKL